MSRDLLHETLSAEQLELLNELADRVRQRFGDALERIAVYGSRARGDAHEDSDIDVIVLLHIPRDEETRADTEIWKMLAELRAQRATFLPVSIVVFAFERFEEQLASERRFARDVESEGLRL